MNNSIAALLILSASSTYAFVQVQVGTAPPRISPLYATETFQRSLLEARLGNKKSIKNVAEATTADEALKKQEHDEKFQRSLLEAKLAYDAIDAALGTPAEAVDVDVPEPAVAKEVKPEPVSEPTPEPVVIASTPVPEVPKPVMPEPVVATKREDVKRTEFAVPRELAIVPINESTVQFTAGAIGAATGLILGGPILGAVGASAFNYLSRKEEDKSTGTSAKKVVNTASQTALLAYNWLAQFEKDNKVVDTVLSLLEKVVDKVKEADSPAGDAIVTLESTLGGLANKVEELNDGYDLVGGAGTVLDSVGDLVEIGVDKVVDLNDEYRFTDRVGNVVKGAVDKVSEK